MEAALTPTQVRSETRAFRVEELIAHARAGRNRVPHFPRGIRWEREDVQRLIATPSGTTRIGRRSRR